MIEIVVAPAGFSQWPALFQLLQEAFSYMHERIDPPSSLNRMDTSSLRAKARDETLIVAFDAERLVGCAFAKALGDALYVGKVAVHGAYRGRGIARRLLAEAENLARANALKFLELQTRVELTENQRTFASLGFVKSGQSAHPGYDRPTSITMRKRL